MKFRELRRIIDDKTSVYLYNGRFNKVFIEQDCSECITEKYDECEVYGLWNGEDGSCVTVNAYIEVTARFTTELDGYTFEKEETYNLLDYDDKDDLEFKIDEDYEEWLEDLVGELKGYAEKEVEGL